MAAAAAALVQVGTGTERFVLSAAVVFASGVGALADAAGAQRTRLRLATLGIAVVTHGFDPHAPDGDQFSPPRFFCRLLSSPADLDHAAAMDELIATVSLLDDTDRVIAASRVSLAGLVLGAIRSQQGHAIEEAHTLAPTPLLPAGSPSATVAVSLMLYPEQYLLSRLPGGLASAGTSAAPLNTTRDSMTSATDTTVLGRSSLVDGSSLLSSSAAMPSSTSSLPPPSPTKPAAPPVSEPPLPTADRPAAPSPAKTTPPSPVKAARLDVPAQTPAEGSASAPAPAASSMPAASAPMPSAPLPSAPSKAPAQTAAPAPSAAQSSAPLKAPGAPAVTVRDRRPSGADSDSDLWDEEEAIEAALADSAALFPLAGAADDVDDGDDDVAAWAHLAAATARGDADASATSAGGGERRAAHLRRFEESDEYQAALEIEVWKVKERQRFQRHLKAREEQVLAALTHEAERRAEQRERQLAAREEAVRRAESDADGRVQVALQRAADLQQQLDRQQSALAELAQLNRVLADQVAREKDRNNAQLEIVRAQEQASLRVRARLIAPAHDCVADRAQVLERVADVERQLAEAVRARDEAKEEWSHAIRELAALKRTLIATGASTISFGQPTSQSMPPAAGREHRASAASAADSDADALAAVERLMARRQSLLATNAYSPQDRVIQAFDARISELLVRAARTAVV